MSGDYCPRCKNWRTRYETVRVEHGPIVKGKPAFHEAVNLSTCGPCGIYWFSDKPELCFELKGARDAD
jgi:hypothetical protein